MVGGRKIDVLAAAQMSLPYAAAARIVLGTAGLSAYAESRRSDPALRAMLDRVFIDIDDSVRASDESTVTFVLSDGTRIEEPTTIALGAPENPISDAGLIAKFEELAELVLDPIAVHRIIDATLALDELRDLRDLLALLSATPNRGSG
jgi:2-methylcitrate dehydratase PrpD